MAGASVEDVGDKNVGGTLVVVCAKVVVVGGSEVEVVVADS
jgi:hypothetical protein